MRVGLRVVSATLGVALAMGVMLTDVSAQAITYTYDALNRLVQVEYSDGATISYTYDAAGNRLTMLVEGVLAQGDVDGDGEVNIEDIFSAIRCTFDATLLECVNPDCTGNGTTDIEDVFCVIHCSFGACPG